MEFQMTPEIRLNPYPMYAMMRASGGMLHLEEYNLWNVFRYDDVKTVLADHTRFSSSQMGDGHLLSRSLISTDPPRHTQLRGLINKVFTPKAIAALEPRIAALTGELLDRVAGKGALDLVGDLGAPLPVMVIAEMLGIPTDDRAQFRHWSDQMVAAADEVLTGARAAGPAHASTLAMQEMSAYFREILTRRRASPENDLISSLLAAEIEGERLSEDDLLNFCWLLLVAGNETTTNLLSNAILTFLEHPDALARLRAEPERIPQAIEEVLRYRSPVQAMFRVATTDVEMAGQVIPRGARVIAWIGSANRDETVFPDPDRFDIGRDPNPHIAFGQGIHFCLGAPLARLEARVALGAILERLQDLERADTEPLEPVAGFIVHGVTRLPLQFRPAGAVR
ncbi:MAG TPA: cytochrome P450 [Symbiobacteriaceae bacterium]|jgi:cytochrome P450